MRRKSRHAEVGGRVLAARLRQGFSQGALSRRSGLDPSYLSRIENGKIRPTLETVLRISDALGISLAEMLALKPGKEKPALCPVSATGRCMLDMIEAESVPRPPGDRERYTPRQVRLLRRLAQTIRKGDKELLSALEILLERIREADPAPPGPA